MKKCNESRRAFTLTELAIVMLFAGLLMGAVWAAASSVWGGSRLEVATAQAWQISRNFRNLYAGINPTTVPDTDSLVKSQVFPADLMVGAVPTDPWNGAISLTFPSNPSIKTFRITFDKVSQKECVPFLNLVPATGQDGSPTDAFFKNGGTLSASMAGKSPTAIATAITTAGGCTAIVFEFTL